MILQDTAPFLLYLLFIFTPFPAHFCKVTFDIPEAYLDPSQLPKKKLFVKTVKSFQPITIFVKSVSYMLFGFFMCFCVLNIYMQGFIQALTDLRLPEIKTQS